MEIKMSGLLGKKIGMTRIFDEDGDMVPVTVIEAGPCYVTQIKTEENDGYNAVQVGFDTKKEKNTGKPLMGHFKKLDSKPLRILKEFSIPSGLDLKMGDELKVDIFKSGDTVKVTGISKGRGFTGVVKRHGFGGGPVTHGQSDRLRAPGSLGQSSYPSRVFKGLKMAGRMGNKKVSVVGLTVAKVDAEKNLLFIKGAVPGARHSFLKIYQAL
jgi:large subunit ribosomal protein L3